MGDLNVRMTDDNNEVVHRFSLIIVDLGIVDSIVSVECLPVV
jgi:hypothetical protein